MIEFKNGITSVTVGAVMPNDEYVEKVATKSGINFKQGYPLFLIDLYTYFLYAEECVELDKDFDIKTILIEKKSILEAAEKEFGVGSTNYSKVKNYSTIARKTLKEIEYLDTPGLTPLHKAFSVLTFVANSPTNNVFDYDDLQRYDKMINDNLVAQGFENLPNYNFKGVDKDPGQDMIPGISSGDLTTDISTTLREFAHSVNPIIQSIIQENPMKSISVNKHLLMMFKAKMLLKNTMGIGDKSSTDLEYRNSGKVKRTEPMSRVSQIAKTSIVSRAMPNFKENLVKKKLNVKETLQPKMYQQGVIFLMDDSASMRQLYKQTYVRASLLTFLEEVVKGNAKLTFSKYTYHLYDTVEVTDLVSAQKLFKDVAQNVPSGNGTDIAAVLQSQIDILKADNQVVNKELFIVLDGEDHVNPNDVKEGDVTINAFCIGTNNEGLKTLCERSGGRFQAVQLK